MAITQDRLHALLLAAEHYQIVAESVRQIINNEIILAMQNQQSFEQACTNISLHFGAADNTQAAVIIARERVKYDSTARANRYNKLKKESLRRAAGIPQQQQHPTPTITDLRRDATLGNRTASGGGGVGARAFAGFASSSADFASSSTLSERLRLQKLAQAAVQGASPLQTKSYLSDLSPLTKTEKEILATVEKYNITHQNEQEELQAEDMFGEEPGASPEASEASPEASPQPSPLKLPPAPSFLSPHDLARLEAQAKRAVEQDEERERAFGPGFSK
jgi:hypothetical protein